MSNWIQLVGPRQTVQVLGIKLVGINAENGQKLIFSIIFVAAAMLLGRLLRWLARSILSGRHWARVEFWVRQGIHIVTALAVVVGLLSIWFNDPTRLATALGLVSAGLAFALQRVVTAFAGYFILLRGKTFNVGDRISMGGVRGDVIALSFFQTTIMEMGLPAGVSEGDSTTWVHGMQYTGRVVTVTNDKIFDQPVYNFTRDFPYIWDEMHIPIPYDGDRRKAEEILLEAADRHTVKISEISEPALKEMERRYVMKRSELKPQVFYRLTDNWVEMSLRFVAMEYGVRALKDKMSRDILDAFEKAGIGIASGTYQIVGMPPIQISGVLSSPSDRPAAPVSNQKNGH